MSDTNTAFIKLKPISELPTVANPLDGEVLFYENDDLKKASLSNIKKEVSSGIKGEAITTTTPTAWTTGDPDLYEKYDVKTVGTFTNFKDSNGVSLEVTQSDLDANFVQFWVKNGVAEKVLNVKPSNTASIKPFEGSTFPLFGSDSNPIQRTYEDRIWQLIEGKTATATDIPSDDSLIWKSLGSSGVSPNFDPTTETKAQGGKQIAKRYDNTLKVLDYFLQQYGSITTLDTSTLSWEAKIYQIGVGYVDNSYNKSVKIDVSNFDKINFKGKKLFTTDVSDLQSIATIIGEDNAGNAFKLLDGLAIVGGILNPNDVPTETYSNIDVSSVNYIYIVIANVLTSFPLLELIDGNSIELDAIKKYIDNKAHTDNRTFNVQDFGAKGDGVTDDRVSIQNAINACFVAGGGKVYFPYPSVYYNLGNSLTTWQQVYGQTNTSGMPSAQLIIPLNSDTTKLIMIEFVGQFKINMADEAIISVGRSNKGFIKSSYVEDSTTNNTSILSSVFSSRNTWGYKNYIHVHIENLIFRNETKNSSTHIENKMHGINMYEVTQFTFNYLKIETSSDVYSSVEPTFSIGVIMPSVNNKAQLGEGSIYITGYKSAIMLGEHTTSNRLIVVGCVNAIELPDTAYSYHSASITHLNAECCRNVILMSDSNQVLNIFNYDVEHHQFENKWYNYQFDIKKTGGSGIVNIFNAQVTKSNVGNVNEFVTEGSPDYKVLTGVGAN